MSGNAAWALGLGLALLAGCNDMVDQPKQTAYGPQVGPAAEPSGMVEFNNEPLKVPPVTLELLTRGQERYRIYCAPCHAELGDGQGMIVQRGFPPPPSFHTARLRQAQRLLQQTRVSDKELNELATGESGNRLEEP